MKKTLIISALLLAAATSVQAADLVQPEPVAPEVSDPVIAPSTWDGGYVGAMGGAGWLRNKYDFARTSPEHTFNGGVLGGFAGWNMQLQNNIVLGVEGDFSYNWNKESVGGRDGGTDWAGSVRGRAGYAIDNALIYGAAGWTVSRGYLDDAAGDEHKKTFNGYTLGAGVDYKFTDNVFGRAEYRFNDFGSEKIGGVKVDPTQHEVLLGVGYKF